MAKLFNDDLFCVIGYSETDPVILWFWEVVEAYPNELKLRLLQVRMTLL